MVIVVKFARSGNSFGSCLGIQSAFELYNFLDDVPRRCHSETGKFSSLVAPGWLHLLKPLPPSSLAATFHS